MQELLSLAVRLAEQAAEIIREVRAAGFVVAAKADESPVTVADMRAEALIVAGLRAAAPDIPVIAEEEVAAGRITAPAARYWLVDPLDGTKAFVRGEAHFTVNIGLIEDGVPVAGAVHAPATGETWFTADGGALKRQIGETGGAPVHVRPRGRTVLALTSHTLKP